VRRCARSPGLPHLAPPPPPQWPWPPRERLGCPPVRNWGLLPGPGRSAGGEVKRAASTDTAARLHSQRAPPAGA
jgi:hypothetical protein